MVFDLLHRKDEPSPEELREDRESGPLLGASYPQSSPGVERAYRFLIHPRVVSTSRDRQIEFLQTKGCSENEIEGALEKVERVGGDERKNESDAGDGPASLRGGLRGGLGGLFTSLSAITSSKGTGGSSSPTSGDSSEMTPETAAARKKRDERRERRERRSRTRRCANYCASCALCLLVFVPTIAWILYFFKLDDNVRTIIACLHKRGC